MNNREALRERFLREPIPTRLGELAAVLAHFASFSGTHAGYTEVFVRLLDEPLCYTEWTMPELDSQLQAELSEIQACLTEWQCKWESINANDLQKRMVIRQAREWSELLLKASGLLHSVREVA